MRWMTLLALGLLSAATVTTAAPEKGSKAEKEAADWAFTPDPALPNVLILGDSISIGYTRDVRQQLRGRANVYRPMNAAGTAAENCSDTAKGVSELDRWLGTQTWAVIHFNWGLHDLKHMKDGKPSGDPKDPVLADIPTYTRNMETIVARLKKTGARLVFGSTTPVPAGCKSPFRDPADAPRYNAAAAAVMQAQGVRVDDLFAFAQPQLDKLQLPQNVHFTTAGSKALGEQVAQVIREELAARK